jgi:hypothetical protein
VLRFESYSAHHSIPSFPFLIRSFDSLRSLRISTAGFDVNGPVSFQALHRRHSCGGFYCKITNCLSVFVHLWASNAVHMARSSHTGTAHGTWHSGSNRAQGQLLHRYPCTNLSGQTIGTIALPAGMICCNFTYKSSLAATCGARRVGEERQKNYIAKSCQIH